MLATASSAPGQTSEALETSEVSLPSATRLTLEDVQFADFAEVVAINGKGDGQWEQLGAAKERP